MTVFRWLLALLAVSFAALQYNDPDPLVWVGLYGSAAVALGLAALGRPLPPLAWCVVGAGLTLVAISWPGLMQFIGNTDGMTILDSMSRDHDYIEKTRELGGAAIAILFALFALGGRKPGKFSPAD